MNEEFEKMRAEFALYFDANNMTNAAPINWSTWKAAWQASRKQALEEAEEKIAHIAAKGTVFVGGVIAADACLEAIRALQKT